MSAVMENDANNDPIEDLIQATILAPSGIDPVAGLPAVLADLVSKGNLRHLGPVFGRFIAALDPEPTADAVMVGCVLLTELEGRGHSCLLLDELCKDGAAMMGWTTEQWQLLARAAALPVDSAAWGALLRKCAQVRNAGDPDLHQPLVLDGERLYLRRYWNDEASVAQAVARRAVMEKPVDPQVVRRWLDLLFDASEDAAESDWQKMACAVAVRRHMAIITGGPGTGKTYTVARVLALLTALVENPDGLRIALAAPTGKAAARLKSSISGALGELQGKLLGELSLSRLQASVDGATTLHSLLGINPDTRRSRHHAGNPLDVDVLVVDEASMIHLEMMAQVLAALPAGAILILLGDKDQLASVEAGAVMGDLCEGAEHGRYTADTVHFLTQACGQAPGPKMRSAGGALAQQTVMLRKSHRFGGPIGLLAAQVNSGHAAMAAQTLRACTDGSLRWVEQARPTEVLRIATDARPDQPVSYAAYLQLLQERPDKDDNAAQTTWIKSILEAFDRFRILCAVREGEWGIQGINLAVQKHLDQKGLLRCRGEWYVGRPVIVTRNDRGLGVYNGDVGVTLPDPDKPSSLRVYFLDGATMRSVLATRLAFVETAFAMTVHKVQGSEFEHAMLVLPAGRAHVVARELAFTGITRAKTCLTLLTPDPTVLQAAIDKNTLRASGLQTMLQK